MCVSRQANVMEIVRKLGNWVVLPLWDLGIELRWSSFITHWGISLDFHLIFLEFNDFFPHMYQGLLLDLEVTDIYQCVRSSVYCCWHVYAFRDDHLGLETYQGSLSLEEKTDSHSLGSSLSRPEACGMSYTHVSMSMGVVVMVFFKWPYCGDFMGAAHCHIYKSHTRYIHSMLILWGIIL